MFDILYADVPWSYKDNKNSLPALGGKTYPMLQDEELQALDVKSIANRDSLLFLWMVWPKIQEGLDLIRAWGFTPITCGFVWVKLNRKGVGYYSGLGSYTCGNTEFVYIGKRGKGLPRLDKSVKQLVFEPEEIIQSPLGIHSEKPHAVSQRIVQVYGDRSRVELFARPPIDEGWTGTGFDFDGKHIERFIKECKDGAQGS